jgi:hypothetical protein
MYEDLLKDPYLDFMERIDNKQMIKVEPRGKQESTECILRADGTQV